jgi:MFS family permease
MVLIIPFGANSGYLTVTLAYLLQKAGVSVAAVGALIALTYIPHTWKFLWAPITDATLDQKRWYLIGSILTGVGIAAMGMMPPTQSGLAALSVVALLESLATTFLGMSVESLMAYATPEDQKGRAGGWFQAGNLGGAGLGGGLGLWLAARLPEPWIPASIVGALCLLCSFALLLVPSPGHFTAGARQGPLAGVLAAVKDLWDLAKQRGPQIALFLCFLPIGAGAAGGLWSAVANEWHASSDTVAFATGAMTGLISAIGCVVGGWICDRMRRQLAYVIYGLLQAVCAVAMALAPRTESSFVVFTLIYAFITGLTYAGFTAFTLEAMGKGAAATKYSVFASLSNMPIAYMTLIDGKAHDRWGSSGMLFTEAALCTAGAFLFLAVAGALMKKRPGAAVPPIHLEDAGPDAGPAGRWRG